MLAQGFYRVGLDLDMPQCSGWLVKAQAAMSHSPVSGSVVVERVPEWIKIFNQCLGDPDAAGPGLAVEKHNQVKLSHGPSKEI